MKYARDFLEGAELEAAFRRARRVFYSGLADAAVSR